jgi:dienelactone hydrolase
MASDWISILVAMQEMRAYVEQPKTTNKVPGIIVIMEAFGVNQHIQEMTDRLSREDYVPVASVLYHRLGSNPLCSDKRCLGAHTRVIRDILESLNKVVSGGAKRSRGRWCGGMRCVYGVSGGIRR